jgi:signal transduction histidine kinase
MDDSPGYVMDTQFGRTTPPHRRAAEEATWNSVSDSDLGDGRLRTPATEPPAGDYRRGPRRHQRAMPGAQRGASDTPRPDEAAAEAAFRALCSAQKLEDHWRIARPAVDEASWIGAPEDVVSFDVRGAAARPAAGLDAVGLARRPEGLQADPLSAENRVAEIALLDEAGVIVATNDAWRAAFARHSVKGSAGVGSAYLDVCRRAIVGLDETRLQDQLTALASGNPNECTQVCLIRTAKGLRWREVRVTPLRIAGFAHFLAIHTDQTEIAQARAALRSSEEQVMRAQQEERHRIAIELHDSISQYLIALSLGITRLRKIVDAPATQSVLNDMAFSVEEAVKEVRVLSYLMKATGIGEEGLEATARTFVRGFGARTGLNATFRAEGQMSRVSPAVQHAAFRIIQEALSNVYRHARANDVEVQLSCTGETLRIQIADDGRGMPDLSPGKLESWQNGVGMAGMQERVAKLGGRFQIASKDNGVSITAWFPLRAA